MAIARSTLAFLGTDETTGASISNGATSSGSEVDVLGDNTSSGELEVFLCFTSTTTAGTCEVTINKRRVTGAAYKAVTGQPDYVAIPTNGTQKIPLDRIPASRYMQVDVKNNGGAGFTNVAVLGELTKYS